MRREGRLKRKGRYIYFWLIHIVVWQKPTQIFKAIILQLNFFLKIFYSFLPSIVQMTLSLHIDKENLFKAYPLITPDQRLRPFFASVLLIDAI